MACIFCRIVKGRLFHHCTFHLLDLLLTRVGSLHSCASSLGLSGEIPSFKLFESERVLAFLDIQPLSKGHAVRH